MWKLYGEKAIGTVHELENSLKLLLPIVDQHTFNYFRELLSS